MIDYKAIGRRIHKHRKNIHMTQAVLAEKIDVSESFISQVERGTAKVSLQRLDQIAEILNVDISLLVSNIGNIENGKVYSEVDEIIKEWSEHEKEILIKVLTSLDKEIKPN